MYSTLKLCHVDMLAMEKFQMDAAGDLESGLDSFLQIFSSVDLLLVIRQFVEVFGATGPSILHKIGTLPENKWNLLADLFIFNESFPSMCPILKP